MVLMYTRITQGIQEGNVACSDINLNRDYCFHSCKNIMNNSQGMTKRLT